VGFHTTAVKGSLEFAKSYNQARFNLPCILFQRRSGIEAHSLEDPWKKGHDETELADSYVCSPTLPKETSCLRDGTASAAMQFSEWIKSE